MSAEDLARLVVEMRAQQRLYFNPRTRTAGVLRESKRLEREVDRVCREILDDTERGQGNLFA